MNHSVHQNDRQRHLYCGQALQEAEYCKHHKLFLHKEDDQLPQSQKRAQVKFSKHNFKKKQSIAGSGASFSTQPIGAGRVQEQQARNLFVFQHTQPISRNDSCRGPKSGRSDESGLPIVSQSTQTHIATGPSSLLSKLIDMQFQIQHQWSSSH